MIRKGWLLLLMFTLAALVAFAAVPRVVSVEPNFGKTGDELVVKGQDLDSRSVAKLFLISGGKDHQMAIREQTAESIRFTIPAKLAPGRYRLMVLTAGPTPAYLEQPIFCEVLDEAAFAQRVEEEAARKKAEEEAAAQQAEQEAAGEQQAPPPNP